MPAAREAGGLSGRPLFHRSTVMLARVYRRPAGRIPLIGIGGIDSGATALAKIEAGATLLQLYTGLIYEGPGLIRAHQGRSRRRGATRGAPRSIADLVGRRAAERGPPSRSRPRPSRSRGGGGTSDRRVVLSRRAMNQIGHDHHGAEHQVAEHRLDGAEAQIVDPPQQIVDTGRRCSAA